MVLRNRLNSDPLRPSEQEQQDLERQARTASRGISIQEGEFTQPSGIPTEQLRQDDAGLQQFEGEAGGMTNIAFRNTSEVGPTGEPQFAAATFPESSPQARALEIEPERLERIEDNARAYQSLERSIQGDLNRFNEQLDRMRRYGTLSTTPEIAEMQIRAGFGGEDDDQLLASLQGRGLSEQQISAVRETLSNSQIENPAQAYDVALESAKRSAIYEGAPVNAGAVRALSRASLSPEMRARDIAAWNNVARLKREKPWVSEQYTDEQLYSAQFEESPVSRLYQTIDTQVVELNEDGEPDLRTQQATIDTSAYDLKMTDERSDFAEARLQRFQTLSPEDQAVMAQQDIAVLGSALPVQSRKQLAADYFAVIDASRLYSLPEDYDIDEQASKSAMRLVESAGGDLIESESMSVEDMAADFAGQIQRRMDDGQSLAEATSGVLSVQESTPDAQLLSQVVRAAHSRLISNASGASFNRIMSFINQGLSNATLQQNEQLENIADMLQTATTSEMAQAAARVEAIQAQEDLESEIISRGMSEVVKDITAQREAAQKSMRSGEEQVLVDGRTITAQNVLDDFDEIAGDKRAAMMIVLEELYQVNNVREGEGRANMLIKNNISRLMSMVSDDNVSWAQIRSLEPKMATVAEQLQQRYAEAATEVRRLSSDSITKDTIDKLEVDRKRREAELRGESVVVRDGEVVGYAPYAQMQDMQQYLGIPMGRMNADEVAGNYAVEVSDGVYEYTVDTDLRPYIKQYGANIVRDFAGSTPGNVVGGIVQAGGIRKSEYVESTKALLSGMPQLLRGDAEGALRHPSGGVYFQEGEWNQLDKVNQRIVVAMQNMPDVSRDERSAQTVQLGKLFDSKDWQDDEKLDQEYVDALNAVSQMPRYVRGAMMVSGGKPSERTLGRAMMWDALLKAKDKIIRDRVLTIDNTSTQINQFANKIDNAMLRQQQGRQVDLEGLRNDARKIEEALSASRETFNEIQEMGRSVGRDLVQQQTDAAVKIFSKANLGEDTVAEVMPLSVIVTPERIKRALVIGEGEFDETLSAIDFSRRGIPAPEGADAFKPIRDDVNRTLNKHMGTEGQEYVYNAIGAAGQARRDAVISISRVYGMRPDKPGLGVDSLINEINSTLSSRGQNKLDAKREAKVRSKYDKLVAINYMREVENELREQYAEDLRNSPRFTSDVVLDPEVADRELEEL